MNDIRSFPCQDVIDIPAAGEITLASFGCRAQAEKRDDIPSVGVEDLLIGRVGWGSDLVFIGTAADVLDVGNHRRSPILQTCVLLTATNVADVGTNSRVDDDVVFARIIIDTQTTKNNKASTTVNLFGQIPQDRVKGRQRESGLADVSPWLVQSYGISEHIELKEQVTHL